MSTQSEQLQNLICQVKTVLKDYSNHTCISNDTYHAMHSIKLMTKTNRISVDLAYEK